MTALATTDDVEAVARAVPDSDTARVERLLEMVSADVRGYTGQAFDPDESTVIVHPHDGQIRLPQRPVTAVSDVQVNGMSISSALYEFTANGYLRRVTPGLGVDLVEDQIIEPGGPYDPTGAPLDEWGWAAVPTTVTYEHGGDVPDDIKMVVAEVAAARWNSTTINPHELASKSENVAGWSESQTFRFRGDNGEAWDPAHKRILDRYRRSGFASLRVTR